MAFKVPEEYRVLRGPMATVNECGMYGFFEIPNRVTVGKVSQFRRRKFKWTVMASDGLGWEHVSVSHKLYTPDWHAMCVIKDLFWDETDAVMQLHPKRSHYVNFHAHCLHLWRPIGEEIPLPPPAMVGPMGISGALEGEQAPGGLVVIAGGLVEPDNGWPRE